MFHFLKTTEAELMSLSQQRRIEELEAQLQEAEDVITDLRAELKQIGDDLDKVKGSQVKPLSGQIPEENASFSEKSAPFSSSGCENVATSDVKDMPINRRVLDGKCCSAIKQIQNVNACDLDNFDPNKSDIASIIMRSKKPELYRNGCTQRIRAFERKLLDENLTPSGYVERGNSLKENEIIIRATDKEDCNLLNYKCDKVEVDKKLSQGERKKPVKRRTLRRRKARFGKVKTLRRCHHGQQVKSGQPCSVLCHCKMNSLNENDRFNEGVCTLPSNRVGSVDMRTASDGLRENLQRESCDNKDPLKILYKGKRKRKTKTSNDVDISSTCPSDQLTKPCQPSPVLSRCRTFAYLLNGGIKSVDDQSITCENEAKLKPLTRLDSGLTLIKSDVNPVSGSNSDINKTGHDQDAAEKDVESTNQHVVVKQEKGFAEDLRFSSSEFNIERIILSTNSDVDNIKPPERSEESPCPVDNNRLLKYTFQRKRKKEATGSPDEIASPEKRSVKRKTVEEHIAPDPQKLDGLSRDSRRLVQVARQVSFHCLPITPSNMSQLITHPIIYLLNTSKLWSLLWLILTILYGNELYLHGSRSLYFSI